MQEATLPADEALADFGPADLSRAFDREVAEGAQDLWVLVAGRPVRLRFASQRLVRLAEAFDHLVTDAHETAALTIHIWDSAEGDTPPLPRGIPENAPRGLRMMWHEGSVRGCYQPGQDTLSVLDGSGASAWFWCQDASELPYWEHAAPFRLILSWWLASQGANLVHGAAVGRPDGGALIVGKGGSGKSTTALLSLLAGLSYASDDYVIVEGEHRGLGPYIHSAFGSGKLDNEQAKRFPRLQSAIVNPVRLEEEKAVFLVNRFAPEQMISSFPLRAVLVPRITGQPDTRTTKGSAVAALAALAPSTIFQLPGAPEQELKSMAGIIRAVPTYVLELGTDLEQIPRTIDTLLSGLAAEDSGDGS